MARDGLFAARVGQVHPRFRAPAAAIIAQTAWSSLLVLSSSLSQLVSYTGFAIVLFAGVAVLALFVLRRREPHADRPFRAWGYPWAPAVFIAVSAVMLANEIWRNPRPTLAGLAVIAAGIPVYLVTTRSRRTPELLHLARVGDRAIRQEPDFEHERFVSVQPHFDPVRTGFNLQALKETVEVVDMTGVVAVDIDRRIVRFDLQLQRAEIVVARGVPAAVSAATVPPRVVVAPVVAAET
jgi:hypothetical protein